MEIEEENDEFKLFISGNQTELKEERLAVKEVINSNNVLNDIFEVFFFGKNPSEFISQSEIKMARFNGVTRLQIIDNKEIRGRIYEMLDEVEIFFKRNTRLANKIVGFKRVDIPEYPYEAVREALINATAHRDYDRDESSIMFSIFDDRVEISNPEGFLPG